MHTQALFLIANKQHKNKGHILDYAKYLEIIWSSLSLKLIKNK